MIYVQERVDYSRRYSSGHEFYVMHLNPAYWKDAETFRLERWIEIPRLARHLISFSKGIRICLGIDLTYPELYVPLGGIIRRCDLYDGKDTQTSPTLALYDTN
jgi:cytochrome P450